MRADYMLNRTFGGAGAPEGAIQHVVGTRRGRMRG